MASRRVWQKPRSPLTSAFRGIPLPDYNSVFESLPGLLLLLTPDLAIVSGSTGYLEATRQKLDEIRNCKVFDIFPDNPHIAQATGVSNLRQSLQDVLTTNEPQKMRVQRYDVRDTISGKGEWIEKYWSPSNHPIFARGSSEIAYIVHQVEDVTPVVHFGRNLSAERLLQEALDLRTNGRFDELETQTHELKSCRDAFVGALERLQQENFSSFSEIEDATIELESRMRQIQEDLNWQKPYLDAIREQNPKVKARRIASAEWAIFLRENEMIQMQVLSGTPQPGQRALRAAKNVLRRMRASTALR